LRERLRLKIAGSGARDYETALRGSVPEEVMNSIDWLGHIEGDQKWRLIAGATLFILPSYSENFGIAAAEALACGTPCVLGEGVAISRRVAEAGAGWVCTTDPANIAAVVTDALGDEARLVRYSLAAAALAGLEYSSEKMGERLVSLYNRCIEQHPQSVN
jgi:glycosyltransferase involved in cell wall biosynthesis